MHPTDVRRPTPGSAPKGGAWGPGPWRRRSQPERFDLYTRWSLYVISAFEILLLPAIRPQSADGDAVLAVVVGAAAVHTVTCLVVLARGLGAAVTGTGPRRGHLVALLVVTGATAAVVVWDYPPAEDVLFGDNPRSSALVVVLGAAVLAVTPVLAFRWVVTVSLAVGLLIAAEHAMTVDGSTVVVPIAVAGSAVLLGLAVSYRTSVWMLGVVWEQDRARVVHARLAVAEERLRFSRDLHDVFGRTLSVVAVKSELAAELAQRGHPGAAEQMLEVRQVATDSLREVRAVVAGYRAADLAAELAGARAVLRSAGIACEIDGAGSDDVDDLLAGLPLGVQEALAWVVREAVTNVVRHSRASGCRIALAVHRDGGPGAAELVVRNDGAAPRHALRSGGAERRTGGAGLRGLTERLGAVGGTLETVHQEDTFTLRVRVPLDAPASDRTAAPDATADLPPEPEGGR